MDNQTLTPITITTSPNSSLCVKIKRKYLRSLLKESDKICKLFSVKLNELQLNSFNESGNHQYVSFQVICENSESAADGDRIGAPADLIAQIQHYIDSLCVTEAEDSSYDSDCDGDDLSHQQVSRTTSDTLGQEFAEYVSHADTSIQQHDRSPGYTQRVEFALKLGYTERLVQAALSRLGPNPAQNELLAELIKLGAQQCSKGEFNTDVQVEPQIISSSECPVPVGDESISISLRPIVIDGSNVAMSHGNKELFSCRGIRLCVDWFKNRGHKDITVFVPKWRKESARPDNPVKDQDLLNELEKERMLVFTPSRLVGGKRMVCYDDRYILKLAAENDGIVVSNDNYRDLVQESSEFKKVVEERVLMYSFVNDRFMPPDDPLGRSGPTLDNFLRTQPRKSDPPPPCPYGKKCTYGNKCKFYHPERGSMPHKSVTERLSEHAARHLQARSGDNINRNVVQGKSLSVPLCNSSDTSPINSNDSKRKALCRTRSNIPPDSNSLYSGTLSEQQIQPQSLHQQFMPNPSRSNWDVQSSHSHNIIDSQQLFPKSHSIENISKETYSQLHSKYNSSMWSRQQQQQQQSSDSCEQNIENVNLHRKLQRQLTLNPAGCDPRIYQMQRCGMNQQQPPPHQQQLSPHRPLAPSLSGPRTNLPNQWDLHQNVTRIASAPDPSRPWHNGPPPASSSEPHINLWSQQSSQLAAQDQRRRLHYHLASIFPEDQVQTVMQMYPEETNPQKICAAIINMYPKM